MTIHHLNITISGKVQGVYYRASAKQKADELGVKGFVRNQPSGSVYIEAEASNEVLQKFMEWCWQGPERAQVQQVETSEAPLQNFTEFEVRR
ncbi:MAG TPA: acylphosphatase [Cyclobacteriaceae bacterium]|nr:acylphosphatase [Cyclobacteriaceae bacterium]